MIIAFEGISGTGKTTIIKQIKTHYEKTRPVHIYQFPYGEQKWQDIINLCRKDWEYPIRVAIYYTAMSRIRKEIESHPQTDLVLLDRWNWSVPAYAPAWLSNYGLRISSEYVEDAVSILNGRTRYTPNRYILLTRDAHKPSPKLEKNLLRSPEEYNKIQSRYEEIIAPYQLSHPQWEEIEPAEIYVQDKDTEEILRQCIEAIDPLLEYADEIKI